MFKKQEQENVNNKLVTQLAAFIFLLLSVKPVKPSLSPPRSSLISLHSDIQTTGT